MSREWRLYLSDMLTGRGKVIRYTGGMDGQTLLDDAKEPSGNNLNNHHFGEMV